jgi:C4-dicarboxylate-specific signal transduction histidine kinase
MYARRIAAKSVLSIPIVSGPSHWILTFVSTSQFRKWSDACIDKLRLAGRILVSAILHARARKEVDRLRLELMHLGRVALSAQLTASLAHELVQPIAAIPANAEALQQLASVGGVESACIDEFLNDIIHGGHRAGALIGHVRALLRKERRPSDLLDFNQLVDGVTTVIRADLTSKCVCLTLRLDPDRPQVRGYPIELQQVILNLLLNGADAMRGITLAERVLTVRIESRAHEVELSVSDRGTGIEPEQMSKLFQPFFTTKSEGLGMGLAICSEVARSHGGRLWAESNSSAGMTFHFALPMANTAT